MLREFCRVGCTSLKAYPRLFLLTIFASILFGVMLPPAAGATGLVGSALTEPRLTEPTVAQPANATRLGYSLTPSSTEPYAVCPPTPGQVECMSILDPPAVKTASGYKVLGVGPQLEGGGEGGGLDPKELQEAYKIPATGGSTQTVAIVDAYDDPNAEADLQKYREKYKIYYKSGETACTKANGCFKKVNQEGKEEKYPTDKYPIISETGGVEDWGLEMSLDLDMVSAACPECHILLVEATNREKANLYAAEKEAASLEGTTEISNSWGGEEFPEEASDDEYFNHKGIPITVAAGDAGYGVAYPAASKDVISVGGTTLKKRAESERGWEESVWGGSGSGCSLYESKPEWQHDPTCARRTDNDVAAVANNKESPVSVYDSYEYEEDGGTGKLGWVLLGGTSVATPLVAGIEAHATKVVKEEGAEAFYRHSLFDVTSGSDGTCGHTYICEAEEGYDGPTGWGAPDGPLELAVGFHAVTEAATSVTAMGAKLNGYVNPGGLETSYHFEYGPTTSYGTDVPVPNASVGSGAIWQGVSQSITGLHTLAGTYHYRLVATNSSGTIYGADHTFTTIPWVIQTTPKPSGSGESRLEGVSCSSSTACIAVSSYSAESENTRWALVEGWNGAEWKSQSTPRPTGATYGWLYGVSCVSSTACTTVGFYGNSSSTYFTLAERWNGTEWLIQTTPSKSGGSASGGESKLVGVSCSSSTACTAVGYYCAPEGTECSYRNTGGSATPLAERWNGTEWSVQTIPSPTGAKSSNLYSVSCVSSTECVAVGSYTNSSSVVVPLAERWNGTEWAIQTAPIPTGAKESSLHSVSCSSSTACTTVGSYTNSSGTKVTLAEHWNGTEWSVQSTPNPTGATESGLSSLSCASSTECIAVGYGGSTILSERWSGTEWLIESTPTPEEAIGFESAALYGVSCLSTKICTAVGLHVGYIGPVEGLPGLYGHFVPLAESRAVPKPYVETKQATSVSLSGATLNGTVNPESTETKYYFEYGLTTSYGSKTAEASAGSGTANVEESKAITGLTASTTYHFRIVATNSTGTADGSDHEFSTTTKPTVETKAATSITERGAELNGAVNPCGLETKYYFEYGTTTSYGSKTPEASVGSGTSSLGESKTITGLAASTTYHFRIVATNSKGTTDGSDEAFSTTAKPTVETKAATSIGETGVSLNGIVNPKGASTKYYFEYGPTASYGSKTAEASAGSGTSNVEESKAITGLTASTTYHFRIVATNSDGTTDGSDEVFSTTAKPTVETKAATSIGETGASLNGTVNPKGASTKYYFEYGLTASYGSKTAEASAGSGTSNVEESKAITGLAASTTYHFRIVATNGDGTTDGSDQVFTTLGWSFQSIPNPAGATESYLAGAPYAGGTHISCPSSMACIGVGFYTNSLGIPSTLAEHWNGTEWSIQSTPNPSGATESYLHGVSCSPSMACTAVGHYKNSSGTYVTLAERWNGTEWSIQSTPNPSGATEASLKDVSCASSTTCAAVGFYISSKGTPSTLAEQWNGSEWSVQSTPNPSGATQSELRGMSCSSSTACTAVGWYKNSSGYTALAERWNGTEWSIQSVSNPTGATLSWLGGVSCASSSTCTAVGDYTNSSDVTVTLAERWNDTEWSVQSIPSPSGSTENVLGGVSCSSSTACTAVGDDKNSSGTYVTLAESWNGTEWVLQDTLSLTGATENELGGVSCSSSTACIAVGWDKNSSGTAVTLAEIYG
jgi:hypothetical protein